MQAIPTTYSGVAFRSRLEAAWARNLDINGIQWQYEPEGYKLSDGTLYLSDFYLPACRAWLEVKGDHNERVTKVEQFAQDLWDATDATCTTDFDAPLVILGRAPKRDTDESHRGFFPEWTPDYVGIGETHPQRNPRIGGTTRAYSISMVRCGSCSVAGFAAIGATRCRCCNAERDFWDDAKWPIHTRWWHRK